MLYGGVWGNSRCEKGEALCFLAAQFNKAFNLEEKRKVVDLFQHLQTALPMSNTFRLIP